MDRNISGGQNSRLHDNILQYLLNERGEDYKEWLSNTTLLPILEIFAPNEIYKVIFAPIEMELVEHIKALLPTNIAKKKIVIPNYQGSRQKAGHFCGT
jgi:hypothetical protein